jgi:hypothetical protein
VTLSYLDGSFADIARFRKQTGDLTLEYKEEGWRMLAKVSFL